MILSADNCNRFDDDALVHLVREMPIRRTLVIETKYKKSGQIAAAMIGTNWKISRSNLPRELSPGSPDQHLYVAMRLLGDWWPTDYKLELQLVGYSDTKSGFLFTFNYTSHQVN